MVQAKEIFDKKLKVIVVEGVTDEKWSMINDDIAYFSLISKNPTIK